MPLTPVTTISKLQLTVNQKKQLRALEEMKKQDPMLIDWNVSPWKNPIIIVNSRKDVIGGFDAEKMEFDHKQCFRAINPYIHPAWRKKGIMADVMTEYFKTRRPAVAIIEDDNRASIALYTSLGFRKVRSVGDENLPSMSYYFLN